MRFKYQPVLSGVLIAAFLFSGCGKKTAGFSDTGSEKTSSSTSSTAPSTSSARESSVSISQSTPSSPDSSSGSSSDSSVNNYEGLSFAVIGKSSSAGSWRLLCEGAKEEAEKLGVTVSFSAPLNEDNPMDQVQMLQNAIDEKRSGIGFASIDTSVCTDVIQSAASSGIPIVGFDSGVPDAPDGTITASVSEDSYAEGKLLAENFYKSVHDKIAGSDKIRIGLLAQDAVNQDIVARGLGFIETLTSLCDADGFSVSVEGNDTYVNGAAKKSTGEGAGIVIEVLVPELVSPGSAQTNFRTLMAKSDTAAVCGIDSFSTEAIISVCDADSSLVSGDGKQVFAGYGTGDAIETAVRQGTLAGAVSPSPRKMGAELIRVLAEAANRHQVKDVSVGGVWYTSENMDDADIAENLSTISGQ